MTTFLCETQDASGALVAETLKARSWQDAESMAQAHGWRLVGELVQRGSATLVADARGMEHAIRGYRLPVAA